MTREEVLCRYRHLRAISTRHHSGALKFLVRPNIMEHAERLGLTKGKVLVAESEEELTLVFDLAIHTAREGRSRAIDRFAQMAQFIQGSDEALMLEAMRRGRFSIWQVRSAMKRWGLWSPTCCGRSRHGWSMRVWKRRPRTARRSLAACVTQRALR
jgi:hypothetical protein